MPFPRLSGRLRSTGRLLLKEIGAFGVVGAVAFVVDVGLFQILYAEAGVGAVTAKVASTLAGMSVAYLGHRFWSFAHREHERPGRQSLVFVLINCATLLLGAGIVALVRYPLGQESVLVVQIANITSIALGSVIRFLGYRRWVFTAPGTEDATDGARVVA
ncbi:GtrA family protein [Geodermatophilus sp. URMC 64]